MMKTDNARFLVVEDSPTMRQLIKTISELLAL